MANVFLLICVVAAVMTGASCRQTASRFGVSSSSAIRWVAQVHYTGDVAPKPRGGPRRRSRTNPMAI
jgi:transposase